MMATAAAALPIGPEWSYEVKWDGYRTLAVKDGSDVRLFSRNLKDSTAQFPSVAKAVAGFKAKSALLDGEVVALDEKGQPSCQALHHSAAQVVVLYAFDVLHLDGKELMRQPLEARRALLAKCVKGASVLLSDALPGTAKQIEHAVRALRLEGVVAKRKNSPYEPGKRGDSWMKVAICEPPGVRRWRIQTGWRQFRLAPGRRVRRTPVDVRGESACGIHTASTDHGV